MSTPTDFPLMPARYPGAAQRYNIASALAPGLSAGGPGSCRIDVDDNEVRIALTVNIDSSDPDLDARTIIPAGALPAAWWPAYRADVPGFINGTVERTVFKADGSLALSIVSGMTLPDGSTFAVSLTAPRSTA